MTIMDFNQLLEKYRKLSFSERDKGDRFERLMRAYLMTDPKYAFRFSDVWLWKDFFGRKDLGGSDSGIDLVAKTHQGDYWAIQCKFYDESTPINKPAVDSFLATSSRTFMDEELRTVGFAHRLWISTTNKWGSNATEAIKNQHPPVTRLNLFDLQESSVDWEKLEKGVHGDPARTAVKTLRPHQKEALELAHEHFKHAERGKLIMACGTGKTFNALRIAENETDGKGLILYLVPSIALLGQTLREWSADAMEPINAICICSDPEVSKKKHRVEDSDVFSVVDLALPASTDKKIIVKQLQYSKQDRKYGLTVVFSTYQSIDVIARAQKEVLKGGFGEFDLIICDEAHRTTGVSLAGEDESAFTKVHKNDFLRAKKRLYMTATPRLYSDDVKSRAAQAEAILCSMDDSALYGEEIYRIGFGEAVDRDLLTDYKVLILTLSDRDIPPALQNMIADKGSEINTDDSSKLIGCINALSKQILGDEGSIKSSDPEPMRRAVAFTSKIKISKKITETFNTATDAYIRSLPAKKREQMVSVASKHIDGTMSAPERDELLGWLKSDGDENECKILTNVRCLSEGVDVPSLDAVMFLSARNSQVDVVQSVGRVMRKAPGKKYGYIIIPVVVPAEVEASVALDDNERYKVVWTVLNALRAHDDRFNATVNKIELNKKRPQQILVGRPEYSFDEDGKPKLVKEGTGDYADSKKISEQLAMQFEQLQSVVFARMVNKVGDRRYWEQWAKSVGQIAERQVERINRLIADGDKHEMAFAGFLAGLQKNINPSITQQEAIEMLSQHIITKPVFEALFEGYSFVKNNPISVSMQTTLDLLEDQSLDKDAEILAKFYESVKMRASGIDNAEGKQRIIVELYDKFFKTAFPKLVEKLGIVYTPVEVVDFIIYSVNDVLKMEFGRTLSDANVHILDPFTGTGTFVTRLIQSGLIEKKDLVRKYENEIHANEIVLLAYYIAAVNIENAFHDAMGRSDYQSFDGICLTDTFQLGETDASEKLFSEMFPQNSERVAKQKKASLRVIMGNPPYSVGQRSANDNAQNQKYEKLDARIASTYASATKAANKNSLYDSYIKAFRWSTDRLDPINGGVIAFVSNGSWLDGNSADGLRNTLQKEFSSIWVFNLRGNQRTSGELSRKEGGKIFGSGSRTPISITILVRNTKSKAAKATIHYHDIGDYLSREDKLSRLSEFVSLANPKMKWETLQPNEYGDWLNQRSGLFDNFIALGEKKDKTSIFIKGLHCRGLETARDAWVYNSSSARLAQNINTTIQFFNEQSALYQKESEKTLHLSIKDFVEYEPSKISWSRSFLQDAKNGCIKTFSDEHIAVAIYRPYFKQRVYFSRELNNVVSKLDSYFPNPTLVNRVICMSAPGGTTAFSVLITNQIPDLHLIGDTQVFPLHYYEVEKHNKLSLFDADSKSKHICKSAISEFIFTRVKKQYGKNANKEDIFYYVYGILHSPEYRKVFANDLKKMLPRIPLVDDVRDFWKFSKAGRQLAGLHIEYESVPAYEGIKVVGAESGFFKVEKMRFPSKRQKDTILFNSKIAVTKIPTRAYEYVVNGKSAIEWIMERYQVTKHKDSGIVNDPNDWAKEVGNPRYILDLLLSIINVSVQTVDIVESLPKVDFTSDKEEKAGYSEHEIVVSTRSISKSIPVGMRGTVIHVYADQDAYEVEFMAKNNVSIIQTVTGDMIGRRGNK